MSNYVCMYAEPFWEGIVNLNYFCSVARLDGILTCKFHDDEIESSEHIRRAWEAPSSIAKFVNTIGLEEVL